MKFLVRLAALALCGTALHCGASPVSHGARVPAIGRPLGACSVGANLDHPLVTEWTAAERSRFEARLAEGPVFVTFTGCELHLLPSCTSEGHYEFERTTPSHEVFEVSSEDQLHAKLPLAAVSLKGALSRSGRLEVETRVRGQRSLRGAETSKPTGACESATHVVRSVAVGAFAIRTTGAISGTGGVEFAGKGLGGAHVRDERLVRTAGDLEACSSAATTSAGESACDAPIELFLDALAPPSQATTLPIADSPERAAFSAIDVSFVSESDRRPWLLQDSRGTTLCVFPCRRFIADPHGLFAVRQENGVNTRLLPLPESLTTYPPRTPVRIMPLERRGSQGVAIGFFVTGLTGFVTALAGGALAGSKCGDRIEGPCTAGLVSAGVGVALLVAAVGYGGWYRDADRLALTPAPPPPPPTPPAQRDAGAADAKVP